MNVHTTKALLEAHMKQNRGKLLEVGTAASVEFDRLYLDWIRARWDAADRWVKSVWVARP